MLLLETKLFVTRQSALRRASVVSPFPRKFLFETEFLLEFIRFDKGFFLFVTDFSGCASVRVVCILPFCRFTLLGISQPSTTSCSNSLKRGVEEISELSFGSTPFALLLAAKGEMAYRIFKGGRPPSVPRPLFSAAHS